MMHDEKQAMAGAQMRPDPRNYGQGRANTLGGPAQPVEPPTICNLLDQIDGLLLNAEYNGNRFDMAADRLTGSMPKTANAVAKDLAGTTSSIEDRLRTIVNQFQINNEWMNDIASRFERAI